MTSVCFFLFPADGHLTFYILAVVNKAAVGILVCIFWWIYALFSLGHIPSSKIIDSRGICLALVGRGKQFSKVVISVYIPTSSR